MNSVNRLSKPKHVNENITKSKSNISLLKNKDIEVKINEEIDDQKIEQNIRDSLTINNNQNNKLTKTTTERNFGKNNTTNNNKVNENVIKNNKLNKVNSIKNNYKLNKQESNQSNNFESITFNKNEIEKNIMDIKDNNFNNNSFKNDRYANNNVSQSMEKNQNIILHKFTESNNIDDKKFDFNTSNVNTNNNSKPNSNKTNDLLNQMNNIIETDTINKLNLDTIKEEDSFHKQSPINQIINEMKNNSNNNKYISNNDTLASLNRDKAEGLIRHNKASELIAQIRKDVDTKSSKDNLENSRNNLSKHSMSNTNKSNTQTLSDVKLNEIKEVEEHINTKRDEDKENLNSNNRFNNTQGTNNSLRELLAIDSDDDMDDFIKENERKLNDFQKSMEDISRSKIKIIEEINHSMDNKMK